MYDIILTHSLRYSDIVKKYDIMYDIIALMYDIIAKIMILGMISYVCQYHTHSLRYFFMILPTISYTYHTKCAMISECYDFGHDFGHDMT